jgi:hypothetical protein
MSAEDFTIERIEEWKCDMIVIDESDSFTTGSKDSMTLFDKLCKEWIAAGTIVVLLSATPYSTTASKSER